MSAKMFNFNNKFLSFTKLLLLMLISLNNGLNSHALANSPAEAYASKEQAIDTPRNVWGYDLRDNPLIPPGFNLYGFTYKAPNEDIVFKLRRCTQNCHQQGQEKYEYAMLWFFAGKLDMVKNEEDLLTYNNEHQLKECVKDRAEIANGECIRPVHLRTGKLCQINDLAEEILIKGQCSIIDNANNEYDIAANRNPEIKRYSIIVARKDIYRYSDQPDGMCDRGGPAGGELIYKQLYPMISVIGLKDGTFITARGDLIIRFDSKFSTKFIAKHDIEMTYDEIIKGNFFVLPYEKINELVEKVSVNNDHGVQGLHDELLLYLYRRPENNPKK